MTKILLATDLSERSDQALNRAARLANHLGSELHVLHVVDEGLPSRIAQEVRKNSIEFLSEQTAGLETLGSDRIRIDVKFGHAWETVVKTADIEGADFVVLGMHRNRGLIELFQGTTLDRVVKASRKPVIVVTDSVSEEYKNVVVGTDFSTKSIDLVSAATMISSQDPLLLVHAYHIPFKGLTMRTNSQGDISQRERDQIEKPLVDQMAKFVADLPKGLTPPNTVIREGGATAVIETEARANHADLIVLGVHARSGFAQTLLGSTAREILSNAPCDLLLVPPRPSE